MIPKIIKMLVLLILVVIIAVCSFGIINYAISIYKLRESIISNKKINDDLTKKYEEFIESNREEEY